MGAYVIVRELGRGELGTVFLAERADGQFDKQVAIKTLNRGADTAEILHRFRAERQIPARLESPKYRAATVALARCYNLCRFASTWHRSNVRRME
jgi:serine/threonine protein kinase